MDINNKIIFVVFTFFSIFKDKIILYLETKLCEEIILKITSKVKKLIL